ncbi:MAG: PEP-CTERM sorting domain-containing protein [Phycisphaerales bacterium]
MKTAILLAALGISCASLVAPAHASAYDFLTVTGNSVAGNGAYTQFNSVNGNGWIGTTHAFSSPAGAGPFDNSNTAINSQFPNLFPSTGPVQGHLAMTVYGYQSVVTFHMQNYSISPSSTVFGIWNITDEVSWPSGPGGPSRPVYRMELLDSVNGVTNPTMLLPFGTGNDQNSLDVQGRHNLNLNPATGELYPGASIPGSIHTNAAFFYNIPATTLEIRIYADLPTLNPIGDGVGYYFAEQHVPAPASLGLMTIAAIGMSRRRR